MKQLSLLMFILISFTTCKRSQEKLEIQNTAYNIKTPGNLSSQNDWTILFDGTSFNLWRGYLSDSMPSEWSIEDNTMVFTPGDTGGKNIITKDTYTNFVLSLEWKISEGGNSGIFWSVFEDKKYREAYMTGPEIQVLDNAKHPDSFVAEGTHKAGSLYDLIACPEQYINPAGEWNLCVIEVNQTANIAKVTMNDNEVMTFPLSGEKWDTMVQKSKFNGWEGFGKYQTGHVGLQDHGDRVAFRNIKIKEL